MANPAIKNGFIPIANELAEHLAMVNITGQEWRIIWVLLRKTWGWKSGDRRKDWDWISITQFEKATGMKKANAYNTLKSLLVKRIIVKQENKLKFNQNYNEWLLVKRITLLANSITPISQKHNKTGSQKHNNKRNKETITKESKKIPPTFEMVKQYCDERNNGIDPQHFIDRNTTTGWLMRNGAKMKDWQAAIRTWETNQKKWDAEKPTKILNPELYE